MKLSAETEFPRSWEDEGISFLTQPYVTGLYMAASRGGHNVYQGGVEYKKLASFLKMLRNSKTVQNLETAKLGEYLDKRSLEILMN